MASSGGIEVGHLVVGFVNGSGELIAHAKVHGEFLVHLPVVLQVAAEAPVADLGDWGVGESDLGAVAEQEVGIVELLVGFGVGGSVERSAQSGIAAGSVAIAAHLRSVHVAAHDRVQVFLRYVEVGVLDAGLEGVAGKQAGVVDLGIPDGGVLILGAGPQAAQVGEAAIGEVFVRDAAGVLLVRGQAGNAELLQHAGSAGQRRSFARLHARETKARFEERFGIDCPGGAADDLSYRGIDVAVAVGASSAGDTSGIEGIESSLRVAGEKAEIAAQVVVHLHVALVAVEGVGVEDDVVVGLVGVGGWGQQRQHRCGIGDDGGCGDVAVQILRAAVVGLRACAACAEADTEEGCRGARVDVRRDSLRSADGADVGAGVVNRQSAGGLRVFVDGVVNQVIAEGSAGAAEAALGRSGQGGCLGAGTGLTKTFVVEEEEDLVFMERTAEGTAELVLVQGRLAADIGLEIAACVQIGVAKKLPYPAVKLVGAVAGNDVDGGAAGAAILRAHVVGDHLKLGDRIGGQLDHLV